MTAIPIGLNTSKRGAGVLPDIALVNLYAEPSETDQQDGVVLEMRPALHRFATVGTGPIRAVFYQRGVFNDDFVIVSGTQAFRLAGDGTSTLLGTVPGSADVRISAGKQGGADVALIANGSDLLMTNGATITTKAFPDSAPVVSVGFINGYFLAVRAGTDSLYYTDPTTGDFAGDRFVSAERSTDLLRHVEVISDEVWLFGDDSIEIFQTTGTDTITDPPFQRIQGRVYQRGVLAPFTVAQLDNTLFWLGDDAIVYRGETVPLRISNHGVEQRIAAGSDFKAFAISFIGHSFYVLSCGNSTLVYDVATQKWAEWQSYGAPIFRAIYGHNTGSLGVYAGDPVSGAVWQLTEEFAKDDDTTTTRTLPIVDGFTSMLPITGRPLCTSVALDCATGLGAPIDGDPLIELFMSRDGQVYDSMGFASAGEAGDYGSRVRWTRLGQMRAPQQWFRWSCSANVRRRYSNARMNEAW